MSLRTAKIVVGLVIAGFILAAAYISTLVVERQQALLRISRYNPTWQVSQTLYEFMLLDQHLRTFQASNSIVEKEDVELRFEILAGRADALNHGSFGALAQIYPDIRATLQALKEALTTAQPFIQRLETLGYA